MDLDDRIRDALPVNLPYDGLVAEAYDAWLPPTGRYSDRDLYRDLIRAGGGPALELGCGNGRVLVGYLGDGLEVEGVDAAADMLTICRSHARAGGHEVTLHHADWTTLDLGRSYATIYNPAGSFALIDDADAARAALVAWRAHLRPGGRLVIAMSAAPKPDARDGWVWRVRRSATRSVDGVTREHQSTVNASIRYHAPTSSWRAPDWMSSLAGVDVEPPEVKPYGVRMRTVPGPAGYQWGFVTRAG